MIVCSDIGILRGKTITSVKIFPNSIEFGIDDRSVVTISGDYVHKFPDFILGDSAQIVGHKVLGAYINYCKGIDAISQQTMSTVFFRVRSDASLLEFRGCVSSKVRIMLCTGTDAHQSG